jgi:hypothetical protein
LGPQVNYVQPQDAEESPVTVHGQFEGLKLIPNPPNLDEWRNKLFHVDDTITLTEEQQVYPSLCRICSNGASADSKRTSLISTTSIRIAQRNGTSANGSFPTIGTAV